MLQFEYIYMIDLYNQIFFFIFCHSFVPQTASLKSYKSYMIFFLNIQYIQ